jgi:hypothetical protein
LEGDPGGGVVNKGIQMGSMMNRAEIAASELCGCFYCLATFPPDQVQEWCDDGQTALCPRCGIDSVIGSASGSPITMEFLSEMHHDRFDIA